MKQYILKDGQLDGLFDGIGIVEAGTPITVRGPEHEALLAAHPAFKQYRTPKEEAEADKEAKAPLTKDATVEPVKTTLAETGDKE